MSSADFFGFGRLVKDQEALRGLNNIRYLTGFELESGLEDGRHVRALLKIDGL